MDILPQRVRYIAKLYGLSNEGLCAMLNQGLAAEDQLTVPKLFAGEVNSIQLDRLVEVSGKHWGFWAMPFPATGHHYSSILYRKHRFNRDLTHQDRMLVVREEDNAIRLIDTCEDLRLRLRRKLPRFNARQKASLAAYKTRDLLGVGAEYASPRVFLEDMVAKLSEQNIVINEHIDPKDKHGRTNLAGFFIKTRTIVFKRHRHRYRELFTLAHELGHYMLGDEDIDVSLSLDGNLKREERWCNEFAFHFILGSERVQELDALTDKQMHDALGTIAMFAERHHISSLAIYYYFLREKRISLPEYNEKKNFIKAASKKRGNSPISKALPLVSPLELGILCEACDREILTRSEVMRRYNDSLPVEYIFGPLYQ